MRLTILVSFARSRKLTLVERVRGEGRGRVDFRGRQPPAVYEQSFRVDSVPR